MVTGWWGMVIPCWHRMDLLKQCSKAIIRLPCSNAISWSITQYNWQSCCPKISANLKHQYPPKWSSIWPVWLLILLLLHQSGQRSNHEPIQPRPTPAQWLDNESYTKDAGFQTACATIRYLPREHVDIILSIASYVCLRVQFQLILR